MQLTWETIFILWNVYLLGFLTPLMLELHTLNKQTRRIDVDYKQSTGTTKT